MSKKAKTKYNMPKPEEWQKMFAGIGNPKKDKEYYKPNKEGWGKIFGEVDISSAETKTANVEAEGKKKGGFARFHYPMSGIMQKVKTEIKPNQRYEIGFKVSTDSSSGFLASTLTFLSDAGAPLGLPSSTGVKLNSLEPGSFCPVSFISGSAPEGAAKAQLAFVVFGIEQDKVVDIDDVSFKVIS